MEKETAMLMMDIEVPASPTSVIANNNKNGVERRKLPSKLEAALFLRESDIVVNVNKNKRSATDDTDEDDVAVRPGSWNKKY